MSTHTDTEVEARWIHIDREQLVQKLEDLGATKVGDFFFREWVFRHDDWYENHRRVRVRTDGTTTRITYKASSTWAVDSTEEVEFECSSAEKAVQFMDAIGVPRFIYQEKKRTTYTLDDITFDLDTWPQVPFVLEIEAPSEARVRRGAELLNLSWDDAIFEDQKVMHREYFNIDLEDITDYTFEKV